MKPLTTDFTPCVTCMRVNNGEPQAYRCPHDTDCQVHLKCKCEDKEHCYTHSICPCRCRQFRAPSLTHSKIGACLHLEWEGEDGTPVNIDCDLNVPTVPCSTPYDGHTQATTDYLVNTKEVNWIDEESKLQSMKEIAHSSNKGKDEWQIKFRLINQDTVLPRQVRV